MRTVLGSLRRIQRLPWPGRRRGGSRVAQVRPIAAGRLPLITTELGEQRRGGARLDQVDGTTCGSAVLVALSTWADPAATRRLDGVRTGVAAGGGTAPAPGFGARYDAWQKQVHRESARFWPKALGTTPWGMVRWLRANAPGAGPYRVRLVDDTSAADLDDALAAVGTALAAGRPVPLLVGRWEPRHYVLALAKDARNWRVYEPTSGQVRRLDPALASGGKLADVLGWPRLHALLLPT